jgi:hypothetical protein
MTIHPIKLFILILLFIFGFNMYANASEPVEQDKLLHTSVAYAATVTLDKKLKNPWASAIIVNIIGIAKETVLDKKVDRRDLGANAIGSLLGVTVLYTF